MRERGEARGWKPHRPFPVKVMNQLGRLASSVGIEPITLQEDRLLDKAITQAGSSDFGDDDFREGLRRFLASARSEARLTLLGRMLAQGYVVGNLANRLRLVDWRKRRANGRVQ